MHTSISMSIKDDLDLVYTTGVGVKTAKQSLDGTRMGILNEVVNWIDNQTPTALKVFFYGPASKGKSPVALTIALQGRKLV